MEKPRARLYSTNPLRRYIADPGAMGFLAFAAVTFVSGTINAGWLTSVDTAIFSPAIFYGGLVQVIAGLIDLIRGEKVSGSTFVAFGFFWVSNGFFSWPGLNPSAAYPNDDEYKAVVGFYLLAWTCIAFSTTLAVLQSSVVQIILLCMVTIDFGMLAVFHLGHYDRLQTITGYFLVVTAALAYYVGTSFLLRGKSPIQLPLFPVAANDDEDSPLNKENLPKHHHNEDLPCTADDPILVQSNC